MNSYYWDNICKMQQKQTKKGIMTYGKTLEENSSLSDKERFEYLEEELIDGLMYIEHIKAILPDSKEHKDELIDGTSCPECGGDSKVIDHRYYKKLDRRSRTRKCLDCGFRWKTIESIISAL